MEPHTFAHGVTIDTPLLETLNGNSSIREWCAKYAQGKYEVNLWNVWFEKEEDATLYTLKFK